jgi:hypothetical protein
VSFLLFIPSFSRFLIPSFFRLIFIISIYIIAALEVEKVFQITMLSSLKLKAFKSFLLFKLWFINRTSILNGLSFKTFLFTLQEPFDSLTSTFLPFPKFLKGLSSFKYVFKSLIII